MKSGLKKIFLMFFFNAMDEESVWLFLSKYHLFRSMDTIEVGIIVVFGFFKISRGVVQTKVSNLLSSLNTASEIQ